MRLDVNEFLALVEEAGRLCFFDTEATGLKGDYNSILCVSIKPWHKDPITFSVTKPGNDKKVVKEAVKMLDQYLLWVSYYGKGFDVPLLKSRLLYWGLPDIPKRLHVDLYYVLKSKILTSRQSQAHLIEWLGTQNRKMTLSPDVWNKVLSNPKEEMKQMIERCERDCAGLEGLYDRTKHLIGDIKRQS